MNPQALNLTKYHVDNSVRLNDSQKAVENFIFITCEYFEQAAEFYHLATLSTRVTSYVYSALDNQSPSMFPLSCARVRAHTSRETSTHKKTWNAHKILLPKLYLHTILFHTRRSKYRWVLVKCCTKEILWAHRLWKIRGNIGLAALFETESHVVTWQTCKSDFIAWQAHQSQWLSFLYALLLSCCWPMTQYTSSVRYVSYSLE